ncbi:MAG: ABC transporter permease subunit [Planctomycetes bacterium]|nr:ABC transporter permease subunit [Planctomycetota bacterium]
MNRGLIGKIVREVWPVTLVITFAVMAFETILAYILGSFHEQVIDQLTQFTFVQPIFEALLGVEFGPDIGLAVLSSLAWVHPVILALVWGHTLTFCTRASAGEIDRGTIDFLLGLPVSRWRLYACDTVVFLASGVLIIGAGLIGWTWGSATVPTEMRIPSDRLMVVVVNFYCLYLAVGGLAYLVSSLSERRGRAIAVVLGFVLSSMLLNFITQFWEPARHISFLGILHYYRPAAIIQAGTWPTGNMVVLLLSGGLLWLSGGLVFARRDICTV